MAKSFILSLSYLACIVRMYIFNAWFKSGKVLLCNIKLWVILGMM